MATEGDKIAAAMLASALWGEQARSKSKYPMEHPEEIAELYGEVLREVVCIDPDTGKRLDMQELPRPIGGRRSA